ncbi:MAG: hypothetical protein RIS26_665 [Actinomycetota bacterium]
MSAIRAAVRPVPNRVDPRGRVRSGVRPGLVKASATVVAGLVVIQLLHALMGGYTADSAYQISGLKSERHQLETQADIIGSEVNSLSSNQNLVNVAHSLGMVSNVNPVFLRLSDGTVIGKPRRAQANERSVSSNLVPNAAMTTDSNTAKLAQQVGSGVLGSSKESTLIASSQVSVIQASPTN